jgi:hypothetical protein
MLGLRLALTQPGPPCGSMLELVRRLDPAALVSAWAGHPTEVSVIRGMERRERLSDIALRASNLAAALAGRWDGGWWLGDVELACLTVPRWTTPRTRMRPCGCSWPPTGSTSSPTPGGPAAGLR